MEIEDGWLQRSLKSAREQVASWPEWKKKAMRVYPKPNRTPSPQASSRTDGSEQPRPDDEGSR